MTEIMCVFDLLYANHVSVPPPPPPPDIVYVITVRVLSTHSSLVMY